MFSWETFKFSQRMRDCLSVAVCIMIACVTYTAAVSRATVNMSPHSPIKSLVKCQSEYFEAACESGDVILMESALYGRMQAGRCVSGNYGNLGCHRDVLAYMDERCSGRRECRVYVGNPSLHAMQPCARDLTSYLDATYRCIPSASGSRHECTNQRKVKVSSMSGYLTSVSAVDEEVGTGRCPWHLNTEPGRRWLITVFTFGGRISPTSTDNDADVIDSSVSASRFDQSGAVGGDLATANQRDMCYDVGFIRDRQRVIKVQVCGGQAGRISGTPYLSEANTIEIELLSADILRSFTPFLIKFEAKGCAPPSLPKHATYTVRGDVATVRCNASHDTWQMTCVDGRWTSDVTDNCTSEFQTRMEITLSSRSTIFPYGILLVVAIGVSLGVFTGGLLLTLAVIYMKRRRRMRALQQADLTTGRQPTLTYYEPSALRCGASLVRGEALSKDEQYQLMAGDSSHTAQYHQLMPGYTGRDNSARSRTLCNNVDLLATPASNSYLQHTVDTTPVRHQQSRQPASYYSEGTGIGSVGSCQTCARTPHPHLSSMSLLYECPQPPAVHLPL